VTYSSSFRVLSTTSVLRLGFWFVMCFYLVHALFFFVIIPASIRRLRGWTRRGGGTNRGLSPLQKKKPKQGNQTETAKSQTSEAKKHESCHCVFRAYLYCVVFVSVLGVVFFVLVLRC